VRIQYIFAALLFLGTSSFASDEVQVHGQVVTISDAPAVAFHKADWSYANTTNPFLLTPDSLTNAMIGVSRIEKGRPLLRGPSIVPATLDVASIRAALLDRLTGRPNLSIYVETIGEREVVVASYGDASRASLEYAFEYNGYLAHVLLSAKPGSYFDRGKVVATGVVKSFAAP